MLLLLVTELDFDAVSQERVGFNWSCNRPTVPKTKRKGHCHIRQTGFKITTSNSIFLWSQCVYLFCVMYIPFLFSISAL